MVLQDILINFLTEHAYVLSFLIGMFSEEILTILFVIASQGLVPLFPVVFFGLIGALSIDVCLFFISRSPLAHHFKRLMSPKKPKFNIDKIQSSGRDKYPLYIGLSKFVYGTRALTIIYTSHKGLSFKRFIISEIISLIVWAAVVVPLAWLAGKGIIQLLHFFKGLEKLLLFVVIASILIYLTNRILRRYFFKRKVN